MSQQMQIAATYMRGGTSKGVFFSLNDLPEAAQSPGEYRDALLLRLIGSPDPYGKHTDGMGGATSSTSKTVILSKSDRDDCDVNYLFGQVSIDKPIVDWSGNCGNLTAAVGVFAVRKGLVDASKVPENGYVDIRIWQQNIEKVIVSRVTMVDGQVQETGDFELDGVTFPAQEIVVSFIDPASGDVFPTGNVVDTIEVDGLGELSATMIAAGIPTVFVNASDIGLTGIESQNDVNSSSERLAMLERIRASGANAMGLELKEHIPKVAFCAPPANYTASSGKDVPVADFNVSVRAVSMGKLHHAMMGTAAVAIACAAAVPGTLVQQASNAESNSKLTFGHPSGVLTVGADAEETAEGWKIKSVSMSRSARTLMEGNVFIPPIS
jgi:probable AcnD-accessory protein PrpF